MLLQVQRVAIQVQHVAIQVQRVAIQAQRVVKQIQRVAIQVQRVAIEVQRVATQVQRVAIQVQRVAIQAQRVATQGLHFFCNHDLRDKRNLICFISLQCVCQSRLLVFIQPDFNLHISCSKIVLRDLEESGNRL